ncbi:hypothetical protein JK208_11860 [Gluconobacter sp. Dm-74]|uniref:hypothetical protein n=1 Tax=Gluconobacter sp. Dm-74 TaxID=2799803 RepID=UPI001B8B586E|nr:hypothetical protein [Gluconobacter sp. Dm-74]MBS1092307.1 hypothetical protein [Gluconobacter sp. Dm-74]
MGDERSAANLAEDRVWVSEEGSASSHLRRAEARPRKPVEAGLFPDWVDVA